MLLCFFRLSDVARGRRELPKARRQLPQSEQVIAAMPDVPTVAESGLPGFYTNSKLGINKLKQRGQFLTLYLGYARSRTAPFLPQQRGIPGK